MSNVHLLAPRPGGHPSLSHVPTSASPGSSAPVTIGRCAVDGCTNSARLRVRIVPAAGRARSPALRAGTAFACPPHARQTALGAALYGATTESSDPSPTAG